MTKRAFKTAEQKIQIINKINENRKEMSLGLALKNEGISDATYYKWKEKFDPAKKRDLSVIKKRQAKKPKLISFPFQQEDSNQPICVIIGPADKVTNALSKIAEIYKQGQV